MVLNYMLLSFVLLIISLAVVIKSADLAIKYSTKLAESFHLSKYVVGFLIVSVISILPETFISITSAFEGIPAFGLGTLFGSNVADLTLVFVLVIFLSRRNLKIESKIIKNSFLYIGIMLIPILLGIDGFYSRLEGIVLILIGLLFYVFVLKKSNYDTKVDRQKFKPVYLFLLLLSMGALLLGSHLTVGYGVDLAKTLGVNPILIGMFVVALGTTLPEMLFSIRASRHHHDDLALGDILGTVIADATIVVGIVAVISPFVFNPRIVYITGIFMVLATILLFSFMKSGKVITKKEAFLLLLFYLLFVSTELLVDRFYQ